MNIARVDLNLLVVLEALLAEQSVTRASGRLGLSQPATSAALSRLRALVDDPLFVRTSAGMHPTARAERIGEALVPALAGIRAALEGDAPFDAGTTSRPIVVAASEAIAVALLPTLAPELARRAPHAPLRVVPFSAHTPPEELARGEVDVALGHLRAVPAGFRRRALFKERLVCAVRAGHPLARRRVTVEAFLSASHVLVSPRGKERGAIDVALARRGLARRVALTVPTLAAAVALLRQSDLVLGVGEIVAAALCRAGDLATIEPPVTLDAFEISAVWHERAHRDPRHAWLRGAIYAATTALVREVPPRGRPSRRRA